MGMSLDLYVNEGNIQSLYLPKAFKDEICQSEQRPKRLYYYPT